MNPSRGLLGLLRPRPMASSTGGASARSLLQQHLQQPTNIHPTAAALTTTFVRNFRVKPRRNRNLPPRKHEFKGHMEQMHFTCFQLAMQIIRKDRAEKAEQIKEERRRIARIEGYLREKPDDEMYKKRLASMRMALERMLILYDINSPRVRYNYLNGTGNMDKPVYRFLAERDFKKMRQKILDQRIKTMFLVPDVMHNFEPKVDMRLRFLSTEVEPGEFVRSRMSQKPPTVKIIPYDTKKRLCTIAIIDPDVPDLERDSYNYRLHWLVSNIEINHLQTQAIGTGSQGGTLLSPYYPPHVHRGAPYHRYCVIAFDQKGPIEKPETEIVRDGFNMRSFMTKHSLSPISAFIFRGKWDKYTKELMQKNNIEGWNLRFVRKMA